MKSREELNKEKQEELHDIETREKRVKLFKKIAIIVAIAIALLLSLIFYTKFSATKGLIVKEEKITSKKLPNSYHGTKIIQFSDLHYGTTIFMDELKSLVEKVNLRKPDIIVFTGDLIDKNYKLTIEEQENIIKELSKLNATIGKYAIPGEEDKEAFQTIFNQCDFTILNNEYDLVYNNDNSPILMVGLNDNNKEQDINNAFRYFNEENHNSDIYTILLLHKPDKIDDVTSKYNVDLALAGHSHNSQIKLPGLGSLTKKEGSTKYSEPYYKINDTKLYISSGVGTNELGLRLFSPPSINFFRLTNK